MRGRKVTEHGTSRTPPGYVRFDPSDKTDCPTCALRDATGDYLSGEQGGAW